MQLVEESTSTTNGLLRSVSLYKSGEWSSDGVIVLDELALKLTKPKKHPSFLMVVGVDQEQTTSSFPSSIWIP